MSVAFGYADPAEQAMMLLDRVRNDAYARAISQVVQKGDVVVDIGSGSGVLAIMAAKAGAQKVFAIERTGMAELVRAHAKENRVADIVDVVRADFLDVTSLDPKPNVIVGEQLGHFAGDEAQHHLYAKARTLARDDVRAIPGRYRIRFAACAPSSMARELASLNDVPGVSLTALSQRLRARVSVFAMSPSDLLGPETEGEWISSLAPLPTTYAATVLVDADATMTGVAVAFDAELAHDVVLSTSPHAPRTHWSQTYFPVDPPLDVKAKETLHVELRPRLVTDRGTWAWTVEGKSGVRKGDAMKSLVGDVDDMKAQLGIRIKDDVDNYEPSAQLVAWATALGATIPDEIDVDEMTRRVFSKHAERYPDESAAKQEVRRLLRVTQSMRSR